MPHLKKITVIGKMMIMEGSILLIPLMTLPFYNSDIKYVWMFIIPAFISILLGWAVGQIKIRKLSYSKIVAFIWMYGFILAAIPFYLFGGITPIQAIFDSVSGFTTTGLSVLDVAHLPHIFLFYRAFLQYVGGVGFVMMMLLFVQEKDSVGLYQAEGHPDKLMPNIGKTAKVIIMMYGFFLVVGTTCYTIAGMPFFDSIVHTMCALSTGGFSNHLDSIGHYHSLIIEWITILLMLIGTTNFSVLLLLFKGRIKDFFKASEIRLLAGITLIFVPTMAFFLIHAGENIGNGVELSFFNAFSALSTTGYATCDYSIWPETALAVMIVLMLIGGGIGSTAGGIKLGRICILIKTLLKNVKKKMVCDRTVSVSYYNRGNENEVLDKEQVEEAVTYAHSYLLIFIIGTIALTFFSGCTLIQGAFEFASSLGTVGLSIGITNIGTSSISLLIEIIGMILGRLEIFVLFQALLKK